MTGRPVRLLTAAAFAAAASLLSVSAASANCGGCGFGYAAPAVQYSAPVVYSYSYAAPVTYAVPCSPCGYGGYASYGYTAPMYVVNPGPTYNAPVVGMAEEAPTFDYGYRRAYPYIGGGVRWHHRHWHRGYGYRDHGYRRFGYRGWSQRGYGYREGYNHRRDYGFREGYGFRHTMRYGMHHPMVGPSGIYRPRHPMVGPGGIYRPRHATGFIPPHRMGGSPMHMMRTPGTVHPRMDGPGKRPW